MTVDAEASVEIMRGAHAEFTSDDPEEGYLMISADLSGTNFLGVVEARHHI